MTMEDLKELLMQWDLSKIFIILSEAGIGVKELPLLKEVDLEKLFPNVSDLGTKIKLREVVSSLKNVQN